MNHQTTDARGTCGYHRAPEGVALSTCVCCVLPKDHAGACVPGAFSLAMQKRRAATAQALRTMRAQLRERRRSWLRAWRAEQKARTLQAALVTDNAAASYVEAVRVLQVTRSVALDLHRAVQPQVAL